MSLDLRLIAYAPNGASLGPLPAPQSLQAGFPLSDLGALQLVYPLAAPRSDLLGGPVEIALEQSTDGGLTWTERVDSRFLYLRDTRDPLKDDTYQIDALPYVWRLSKARVPLSGLNAAGKREFAAANVGTIVKTLWDEAVARGALAGMSLAGDATADADGVAWSQTLTVDYDPGTDLLAILIGLAQQGLCEFRTQGRTVRLIEPGNTTDLVDRTTLATPVVLRYGEGLTEAPTRRTWEGLADTLYVLGDQGTSTELTNAAADKPWGRWEGFLSASGVTDPATLSVLGNTALGLTDAVRAEFTAGLDFGATRFLPFRDYRSGDWIYWTTDPGTAPQRMKVTQVTLTMDNTGRVGGNAVVNDRFVDADVRTQRRLNGLAGNGLVGGSGGAPTGPDTSGDTTPPGAVGALTGTTSPYYDDNGNAAATVNLDWPDVTTDANGNPLTDFGTYEVWETNGAGDLELLRAVGANSAVDLSPYPLNTTYNFRVRAVDSVGNVGALSPVFTITTTVGATPPTPSTPVLTARLGVLLATWDGAVSPAGAIPADFARVEVHSSDTTGFAPSASTLDGSIETPDGGQVAITGLAYNVARYVKFVMVSRSGVRSAASAQASQIVTPLVNTDLIGKVIDGAANIVAGSITAGSGLFAAAAIGSADINSIQADKITAGTLSALVTISGSIRTAASGARVELSSAGLKAYNSSGTNTVTISAADGSAYFQGTLEGTFRTGPTSVARLEMRSYASETYNGGYLRAVTGSGGDGASLYLDANSGFTLSDNNTVQLTTQTGNLIVWGGGSTFHHTVSADNFDTAGAVYSNNWFRSRGQCGWYSESYGGGWYMIDGSWIRAYGGKGVYLGGGGTLLVEANAGGGQGANIRTAGSSPAVAWYNTGQWNDIGMPSGTGAYFSTSQYGDFVYRAYSSRHFFVNNTGSAWATTYAAGFSTQSSRRYKKNIRPTGKSLADLLRIEVTDYQMDQAISDDGDAPHTGMIAEDLVAIYPEAVSHDPDGIPDGIDYGKLTPLLIKAVQELEGRLATLERRGAPA